MRRRSSYFFVAAALAPAAFVALAIALPVALAPAAVRAQEVAGDAGGIEAIRAELERVRSDYEGAITRLETRLKELEARQSAAEQKAAEQDAVPVQQAGAPQGMPPTAGPSTASGRGMVTGNAFNPSIGVIFNGRFTSFSRDPGKFRLSGFPLGGESGPGPEGFALDETELNFSANVNDLFFASTTAALDAGDEGVEIDLEEAFIQTLHLPYGMTVKAGRFFAALGYLNENHTHTDNFADRPLPYTAFLADQFGDDGIQLSVVLPTDLYVQLGGGLFRGADFPGGGAANGGVGAYSGFLRLGGDIGFSSEWRAGISFLHAEADGRETGPEGADPADLLLFDGDSDLLIADFKYLWAPNGNTTERYFSLQGEYMHRKQDGSYNGIAYDGTDGGWYMEGVYKFARGWRFGYRHARLNPEDDIPVLLLGTELDALGHSPRSHSLMVDWARNGFSSLRLQVSRDLSQAARDNRIYLQYIMAIGAHGAHNF